MQARDAGGKSPAAPGPALSRLARALGLLLAVAILLAGLRNDALRDAEGFLTGAVALPLGLAAAVAALGLAARPGWVVAGRWAALALVGQGAVLALVDAGNLVAYQHLRTWYELGDGVGGLALFVLVGQGAALLAWGRGVWTRVARGAVRGWWGWRLGAVVVVFVLTSATLSRDVSDYLGELLLASLFQGLQLWSVAAAAAAVPSDRMAVAGGRLARVVHGPEGASSGRLPWVLALWTVAVAGLLSWFAYQRHPHVPDEVVYILHARYFAAGMLELPLPPAMPAFDLDLMTVDATRWFSPVPPGWPAILALGVLVGAPWLVNPVLGGLAVVLTHASVREIYQDRVVARLSTILLATSPWFLFMSMNFMTHTLTLVAALLAAWCTARLVRGGGWGWAVAGGIGIGLVALNRPLEGLVVAGLLGLWSLVASGSPIRTCVARTGVLAAVTLAVVSVTLPYNQRFTGRALHFPIMDYTDRVYGTGTNAMGFGPNRGLGWPGLDPFPGHGLIDVLVNGNLNAFQVNVELLGWGVGSLLVIALLAFGARKTTADWMMIAAIAAVVGAHSFYWFSGGPDFGARYWYLILVPALALAARGLLELGRQDRSGLRIWPAAALVVVGTVVVFLPWRAIDKYHHYRGMRPDVRELALEVGFGDDALVLVRGERHPDYASAAIYNPLDLSGPGPLYAWDRDDETRRAVLGAYPERRVWIVEGPTVSGAGFRVVAGPLDPSDAAVTGGGLP